MLSKPLKPNRPSLSSQSETDSQKHVQTKIRMRELVSDFSSSFLTTVYETNTMDVCNYINFASVRIDQMINDPIRSGLVNSGKVILLCGPKRVGKSTCFLRMISGYPPNEFMREVVDKSTREITNILGVSSGGGTESVTIAPNFQVISLDGEDNLIIDMPGFVDQSSTDLKDGTIVLINHMLFNALKNYKLIIVNDAKCLLSTDETISLTLSGPIGQIFTDLQEAENVFSRAAFLLTKLDLTQDVIRNQQADVDDGVVTLRGLDASIKTAANEKASRSLNHTKVIFNCIKTNYLKVNYSTQTREVFCKIIKEKFDVLHTLNDRPLFQREREVNSPLTENLQDKVLKILDRVNSIVKSTVNNFEFFTEKLNEGLKRMSEVRSLMTKIKESCDLAIKNNHNFLNTLVNDDLLIQNYIESINRLQEELVLYERGKETVSKSVTDISTHISTKIIKLRHFRGTVSNHFYAEFDYCFSFDVGGDPKWCVMTENEYRTKIDSLNSLSDITKADAIMRGCAYFSGTKNSNEITISSSFLNGNFLSVSVKSVSLHYIVICTTERIDDKRLIRVCTTVFTEGILKNQKELLNIKSAINGKISVYDVMSIEIPMNNDKIEKSPSAYSESMSNWNNLLIEIKLNVSEIENLSKGLTKVNETLDSSPNHRLFNSTIKILAEYKIKIDTNELFEIIKTLNALVKAIKEKIEFFNLKILNEVGFTSSITENLRKIEKELKIDIPSDLLQKYTSYRDIIQN
jgi:acyl carrier protein